MVTFKGTKKLSFKGQALLLKTSLVIVIMWALVPFLWAIGLSFKHEQDIWTLSILPFVQYQPTLQNWLMEIQERGPEVSHALTNSMIIAISTTGISLLLGTLAGYSLARFKFKKFKNENIATFFLSLRIIPPVAMAVPFFLIIKSLGLTDTVVALILINTIFVLPFAVLISRSAFKEIPVEIEECAYIDGCSPFHVFLKIALPLAAPSLVAAALICLAFTWNEFLYALMLTYERATPIPVTLAGYDTWEGVQFHLIATRLLIMVIPTAAIAIFLQRYLVRGLTFGAIK